MKKFLRFEKFITPVLVKFYWYFATAGFILSGASMIIRSFDEWGASPFSSTMQKPAVNMLLQGIGIMIFAPLTLRVICELVLSVIKQPNITRVPILDKPPTENNS